MHTPLLTDLYQLTMSYGYWKNGMSERDAVFHLFFRRNPLGGDGALVCGTGAAADYLEDLCFEEDELEYLAGLNGIDDAPLFEKKFLQYLRDLKWNLEVDAVPEGVLLFPNEPILRVKGPLLQCQLVETALLNLVNFQTLIATKAAHLCAAAEGDPVFEFGLRRAQGPDGGLSASRAAYVGGCKGTSNVLAGMRFGIPVKGTHAHSWVMSFESEPEAFQHYIAAMPNNATLLVDTYNTISGVQNAILAGQELRKLGHELVGIRLDSGDLAALSIEARTLLDEAGFSDTKVIASNDLDVASIGELKRRGARIDIWGVGTNLVTSADQPALGGVYKLGAIRDENGQWQHRMKLSNDAIKASNPGILQVARIENSNGIEDLIFDELDLSFEMPPLAEPLLVPAVREGKRVMKNEPLCKIQTRAEASWKKLGQNSPSVQLSKNLKSIKNQLLIKNGITL